MKKLYALLIALFLYFGSFATVAPITGANHICVGAYTPLYDTASIYNWSSSNPSVASVGDLDGVMTGIAAGTATITYTTSLGYATLQVTVDVTPLPLNGIPNVMIGGTTSLSDVISTGGNWSTASTLIATVGSGTGTITGVSIGSTLIKLTLPDGCWAGEYVEVYPPVPIVNGPPAICDGSSIALTDSSTGGTWVSSHPTVATVGAATGIVTGVGVGTAIISYQLMPNVYAAREVTVNAVPFPIEGVSYMVVGDSTSLSDAYTDGSWTSSNSLVASVGSSGGTVLGISAGTAVITCTLPGSCYVTDEVTVYAPVPAISGIAAMCDHDSTSLSDSATGGTWISSNTAVATVGAGTGLVTGVAPGTAIITYQIVSGIYATQEVSVNVAVASAAITGNFIILAGSPVMLSDTSLGGIWTSSDTAVATTDSVGTVLGLSAGTAYISYTIPDGCLAAVVITVYDSLPPIIGSTNFCSGSPVAFTDTVEGGVWGSSDTAVAKVDSSGIVTGIVGGTVTITYTVDTSYVTQMVTVKQSPSSITLYGPEPCINFPPFYFSLIDTTSGGMWTSSDTLIGVIDSIGILTKGINVYSGDYLDSTTISYTLVSGCSASIEAYLAICEGVPTIANTNEISIFPNPAATMLTIQSSKDAIIDIVITDLTGQLVSSKRYISGGLQVDVDVSTLPSGIYFVKVNNTEVRKFVKE